MLDRHLVGFTKLLEAFICSGVAMVLVRVVFPGQHIVGALDGLGGRVLLHPQQCIVIC